MVLCYISLFVPYFVTLDLVDLLVTLLVFLILIFVLVYTAQRLANISGVGEIVEKFSRWIMAVIYIGLGLFIIIENHTIQTIISITIAAIMITRRHNNSHLLQLRALRQMSQIKLARSNRRICNTCCKISTLSRHPSSHRLHTWPQQTTLSLVTQQ